MRNVLLVRTETGPAGTFGRIASGCFQAYTVERPINGDHPCIPAGVCRFALVNSPRHGVVYEAKPGEIKGRTKIQFHPMNWASESLGCIGLGRAIMDIQRKDGTMCKGVSSSLECTRAFMAEMDGEDFQLTVIWGPEFDPPNEPGY